jgi:hypothetical protein
MTSHSSKTLHLKPTQFAVGMLEVIRRRKEILWLKREELDNYIQSHRITIVIAPNKQKYIIDGHHHVAAYWMAGVKKVRVHVERDFSRGRMSYQRFWKLMKDNQWCHLYDRFGDGPRDPMYLPHDIRGLSDDPYRSLAWLVACEGYSPGDAKFAQFHWANLFRRHRLFSPGFDLDYRKVLPKAIRLIAKK